MNKTSKPQKEKYTYIFTLSVLTETTLNVLEFKKKLERHPASDFSQENSRKELQYNPGV